MTGIYHDGRLCDACTAEVARQRGPSQRLAELAGEVAEVCEAMGEWCSTDGDIPVRQWRLCLLMALREAQR